MVQEAAAAAARDAARPPAVEGRPRGELRRALAMEATKLLSLRTTVGAAVLTGAVMAVFAALMGLSVVDRVAENPIESGSFSFTRLTSQGVFYLVQFIVLAIAALSATSEYADRSVTATLLAVPRRGRVLAARTAVAAAYAFVLGSGAVVVGVAVLWAAVGRHVVFDPAAALQTVAGAGLCMSLLAALFVGLGTVLRSAAATIGVGVLLLVGVPMVLQLSGVAWLDDLAAVFPGLAGIEFYAAGDAGFYTAPHDGPVNIAAVLGWAAAAQIAALVELRSRDI
ncbi:ABC transporter permease [Nocardiopsis coralliicola]